MSIENKDQRPGSQAVTLWEALTGASLDSPSYPYRPDQTFSLYDANKRIKEALKTGDKAIVSLIVRSMVPRFTEALSFPLAEYHKGSERISRLLVTLGHLDALFDDSAVSHLHDEFFAYAEAPLAFYRDQTRAQLSQSTRAFVVAESGNVGLDALHGVDRLTRLMICDGTPVPASEAKLGRDIYVIERIEELLVHAKLIPTGFSLCVIRGQSIASSYFVMVVRTGSRIIALTDKGTFEHPLQEQRMQSRNDRFNSWRIEGSHFPYSLLNIQWLDRERTARERVPRTAVAPVGTGLPVLATIGELGDRELLWLQLFIDQCKHRYFDQQLTEPPLATGSMLHIAHKLARDGDQYPVVAGRQVEMMPRSSKHLTAEFFHQGHPDWARMTNPNLWMEARYADQVPDECLYIPAAVMDAGQILITCDARGALMLTHGETTKGLFVPDLKSIPMNNLATPERIVADAHYIARHNQVEIIRGLAAADYTRREIEMQSWFYKAVKKNLPKILEDLLSLNHTAFHLPRREDGNPVFGGTRTNTRSVGIYYEPYSKQHTPDPRDKLRLEHLLALANKRDYQWDCYLQPGEHVQANTFVTVSTETIHDIMVLTGLPLSDIPPELHSRGLNIYTGNHTLSRLDPLSRISNPWDGLALRFRLPLNYQAFKAYRRERGMDTPNATALEEWAKESAKVAWQAQAAQVEKDGQEWP